MFEELGVHKTGKPKTWRCGSGSNMLFKETFFHLPIFFLLVFEHFTDHIVTEIRGGKRKKKPTITPPLKHKGPRKIVSVYQSSSILIHFTWLPYS